MTGFAPPYPAGLSHYRGEWRHDDPDEPVVFWFEVDAAGNVLRQVEIFADGRAKTDAVARYADGLTMFGAGTLHGASFWESEWDGVETVMAVQTAEAFEGEWQRATVWTMLPPGHRLSETREEMQVDVIHGYLTRSYWAAGIPRETVERAIAGSHVVGIFAGDRQLGFARVVTDHATFAYLADVFVLEEARGQGLARAMVAHLQAHPLLQGLRRWMLATRDAHGLYQSLGWTPVADPAILMQRHDPDVYAR